MCKPSLRRAIFLLSAGFGLVVWSGCANQADVLTRQLESKDPAERIRAIHAVGEQQIEALLPALVNRLDDADVAVRLYAIVALEKLTGTRLGYDYAAGSDRRREAVASWRRFVEERAGSVDRAVERGAEDAAPSKDLDASEETLTSGGNSG